MLNKNNSLCIVGIALVVAGPAMAQEKTSPATDWSYGLTGGAGYFNFRNSLYVDREPDPPGNLGEDWVEFVFKPWAEFRKLTGATTWFGKASWVHARTDNKATPISGGAADSSDFDDLYVGFRRGTIEDGMIEIAAGRYSYELAHAFLLSDGYADGGSRGGYWSNPRRAWAPGARAQYRRAGHMVEAFYLDRDERPESDAETSIAGANYEWLSGKSNWRLGAAYFELAANDIRAQLDGARVYNLRAFTRPFAIPLVVEAEIAREDNGDALDSSAWYVMANYSWDEARWRPMFQYRYAFFEGDDPATAVNEDFDPLFPGFRDWGTWWQGEIAGEYFLSNSNLKTHMFRLHVRPTDKMSIGFIYFDYELDQPGSYNGGVSSSDLGQEFNWYMDWQAFEHMSFSFVIARNEPGAAVAEAFNRTDPFKYAMLYLNFSFEKQ